MLLLDLHLFFLVKGLFCGIAFYHQILCRQQTLLKLFINKYICNMLHIVVLSMDFLSDMIRFLLSVPDRMFHFHLCVILSRRQRHIYSHYDCQIKTLFVCRFVILSIVLVSRRCLRICMNQNILYNKKLVISGILFLG